MASANTPRSFRPGKARAALMDAWAAERGLKPAEALAAMVDTALGVNTSRADIGKPTAPKIRARWSLPGVPFGPVDAAPGSRLKGAAKATSRGK